MMCTPNCQCDRTAMNRTLLSTGKKLYLNDEFADFHFIFKLKNDRCERVPVHKMLLANASDVFQVMFDNSWNETNEVVIVDASADAFKEFLQFFYLGKVELTMRNITEVMNLGKKYDVVECFSASGEFLIQHLAEDICWGLELAVHFENKELEKFCEQIIELNTKSIFASQYFLKCDQQTVKRILQMDSLNCTEVEVFEALIKWMKAKCQPNELTQEIIQSKFPDLLHAIRFGSMTLNMFLTLDASYGSLLTLNEYREIVRMIASHEYESKLFNGIRRNHIDSLQWNEAAVIKCNREIDSSYKRYYIKNCETTTFTINKLILLGAFSCRNLFCYHKKWEYLDDKVESEAQIVEICDSSNSNKNEPVVLYSGKTHLETMINTRVRLPKPILIRPGFRYQIKIMLLPPKNCCTDIRLKTELLIESDICVVFHDDPLILNDARGLIAELELNRI